MTRKHVWIAAMVGVLALTAAPTVAAAPPEGTPPHGNGPVYTPGNPEKPLPGPKAGLPAQAKAYGRYCKGKSKKHVKGVKGTEFSQCVKAMARAATNEDLSPGQACKGFSKKHVKGEKGTEFSQCVKAAAKLRSDLAEDGS